MIFGVVTFKSFILLSLFVPIMTTTIKYFLYARKSSEGEDRQMTSIEDQISEVTKLAKELNIEIVDVISESKSAKKPGREKFNEMLTRIEQGEAQGILCWKLNRLARNPIDGGRISWLLQQNIIKHIQTYGQDYKPTDNVIMMSVEFGMSNQYVKDLSVDVKRGLRKKAERGWYPVTQLPLGYLHNVNKAREDSNDEIIIDKESFYIIKKLWKLLLTGFYTIADISREAHALGLTSRKGSPYSLSSFYLMARNEFYCGFYYWNDGNGNRVRYLGNHKPMLSESEFLKVQKILQKDRQPTRVRQYYFPYRGIIACGECNGHVTAENKLQAICTHCKHKFSIKTKKYCPKCKTNLNEMKKPSIIDKTYYHCTKKINKDCSQGSITDVAIDTFILQNLKQISISKPFYDFAIKSLKKLNAQNNSKNVKVLAQLKKRKAELQNRSRRLIEMRLDNELTAEQLNSIQTANEDSIKEIENKIIQLTDKELNWFKVAQGQLAFAKICIKEFKKADDNTKRDIASKIGSNLILKDKSLYFKRLKPL